MIKNRSTKIILMSLILTNFVFFAGCSDSETKKTEISREAVPPVIDPQNLVAPENVENDEQINKKNFDQIKNGMSLWDVEILIAGTSELVSSTEKNGIKRETYQWETPDKTRFIEVTLEGDKVIDKKSQGLK